MWLDYYNILKNYWYSAGFLSVLFSISLFVYTSIKEKDNSIITSIEVLRDDILKKREGKLSQYIKKIIATNGSTESIEDSREKKEILIQLDKFFEYKQAVDKHFKKHHNAEQKAIYSIVVTIILLLIGVFPQKYLFYSKDIAFTLNTAILFYLLSSLISIVKSKIEIRKINNDQDLKC